MCLNAHCCVRLMYVDLIRFLGLSIIKKRPQEGEKELRRVRALAGSLQSLVNIFIVPSSEQSTAGVWGSSTRTSSSTPVQWSGENISVRNVKIFERFHTQHRSEVPFTALEQLCAKSPHTHQPGMKYSQCWNIFTLEIFLAGGSESQQHGEILGPDHPASPHQGRVKTSHWSETIQILCSDWLRSALLCHKEPAQGSQSPLSGPFLPFHCVFIA